MTIILAALSTIAVGLTSGLYWGFSIAVMPGLRDANDHAFVSVMQGINRRIQNPWFVPVFLGSLLLPLATAVALLAGSNNDAKRWGLAGAVAAAVPFAITVGGNIPLNAALDAAGTDDQAAARRAFERPWTQRNALRATTSTIALATLIGTTLALR